jgi:hypothetical protein
MLKKRMVGLYRLLRYASLIAAAEAARSVKLQLLELQEISRLQVSYQVVVNEASEWSDAEMQVCIWRAFTSSTATPYEIGSIQAAECYPGASGMALIEPLQAGTYVIKAIIVRRGIAQLDSTEALSDTAALSVTINEKLQVDMQGPDYNNDERMQRLQQSLYSMRSVLRENCSELIGVAVLDKNDALITLLLLDTSFNPYLLRTDVAVQPLLESECCVGACTTQLTALRQHAKWTKVSSDLLRGVVAYQMYMLLIIFAPCVYVFAEVQSCYKGYAATR